MERVKTDYARFKNKQRYQAMLDATQDLCNKEIKVWEDKKNHYLKDAAELENTLNDMIERTQYFVEKLQESKDFSHEFTAQQLKQFEKPAK